MRKLHLGDKIIEYRIYESGTIVYKMDNKKFITTIAKVKDISPAVFERGRRKRTSDAQITPSELKTYLAVLIGLDQARKGKLKTMNL